MSDRTLDPNRYLWRRLTNGFFLCAAIAVTALGLVILASILITLIGRGFAALSPQLFSQPTPPPGNDGGLSNAILGSVLMTMLATLIGTPVGVLAGTWLAEYGRGTLVAATVRFINDILLSAPSILIGLFIYQVVVVPLGHFSGWAGAIALAVILIPVVVRTTEDMLLLVPDRLREAAAALGAPYWRVIVSISYRSARTGILTGVLLGIARIAGETAPLLFTALNNQFQSLDLNGPMANLPVVIFQFAMSPYDDWQRLAWAGALLITVAILVFSVTARIVLRTRDQTR
ncbi:MAG: phosphate ABC transporter permease PstA [Azospirillaceae bacterium]|nr:phosphate ABC transporter permease PstA [Azospirillaceae bacterium]